METYSDRVDVVIIGGGTAGAIAAIQAGPAGAKTAVVEMDGQLGGVPSRDVPVGDIRALLSAQGAIMPEMEQADSIGSSI